MEIKLSKAGKIRFEDRTKRDWHASDPSQPDILQSSIFAGEQMIAYGLEGDDVDDDGRVVITAPFTLSYFGFKAEFNSMADAKENAPEFAREVLRRMLEMI